MVLLFIFFENVKILIFRILKIACDNKNIKKRSGTLRYINVSNSSIKCSQIIMGTSSFRQENKKGTFELLDKYIEYGGNTLDTAHVYGFGESESVLAEWIQERQMRKSVIIISKGGHHYIDEKGYHHPEIKRVKPEFITKDLFDSLETMKTDYFDIYLIHRDDKDVPVGELMDMLEEHKKAGRIISYGVSNWSTQRIEEANRYAKDKGYIGIAINSPSLSLAKANKPRWDSCVYADNDYIRWHKKMQMPLLSWAPQASGFFTGSNTNETVINSDIARTYYNEGNWERLKRAQLLAEKKGNGIKATNIALAYVLNQPFPNCSIIGTQKIKNLLSNFSAAEIKLSEKEMEWLNLELENL